MRSLTGDDASHADRIAAEGWTYNGLIGHIDRRDPIELLHGDSGGSMVWDAI
ncbi:MAG: hypothetical protein ACRDZN_13055 [Acidimicrobiales bacterium]